MIEDHIYWEGIISFSGTGMMTSTTQHVKVCLEYLPASAFVAVSQREQIMFYGTASDEKFGDTVYYKEKFSVDSDL